MGPNVISEVTAAKKMARRSWYEFATYMNLRYAGTTDFAYIHQYPQDKQIVRLYGQIVWPVEQQSEQPIYKPAGTILTEAEALVGNGGERNDAYDHPRNNFAAIASFWSVVLGCTVTPRQVGLCMIAVKLVRESHKHKRDNLVDLAGYARCIERLEEPA